MNNTKKEAMLKKVEVIFSKIHDLGIKMNEAKIPTGTMIQTVNRELNRIQSRISKA